VLKIKVVQTAFGNLPYFALGRIINEDYCRKNGYEYEFVPGKEQVGRNVTWCKPEGVLRGAYSCDYLLYLDCDACFYTDTLKIENELIPLLEEKLFLFAVDKISEQEAWYKTRTTAGCFLMRVCEESRQILKDWDAITDEFPDIRDRHPPDQLGLDYIIERHEDKFKIIPDYYLLHGTYSHFIRHFAGASSEYRTEKFREIAKRKGLL